MKRTTSVLLAIIVLGVSTAALLGSAVSTASAAEPQPRVRILLYGDSLSGEAERAFVDAITRSGRAEVRSGVYGGTAICDWLAQMDDDVAWQPDAVVVEFSGNAWTPCMRDAAGDAYWDRYRSDARAVLDRFPDAHVYLVGVPVSRTAAASHDPNANRLNEMYAALALADPDVEFVPAQRSVLRPDGSYADVLPCLPGEPCSGSGSFPFVPVNVVRAPDGGHFCPEPTAPAVNGVTGICPVWSSGAFRFGSAMAEAVVTDFGL